MRLVLLFVLAAAICVADGWDAVQRVAPGQKIEVTSIDGKQQRTTFVSATSDSLVVRDASGEHSMQRAAVEAVRIHDPSRRVKKGLIWTAVGAGAGVGIGFAVCPYCSNEGHGNKYVGPGAAIGASVGALGFLSSPYRRIYKSK